MKTKNVSTPSDIVASWATDHLLVSSLLGGTDAMRQAGARFLPKWPGEQDKAWRARLATAYLFPAYKRTVKTLAAKPLSKPIALSEDVPETMQDWLKNCDLQGRNLDAFTARLLEEVMGPGIAGIFVDFSAAREVPRTESGVTTQAAEAEAGLRPYFVLIRHCDIIGWRSSNVHGMWGLEQLRFWECVEEVDGAFDTREVRQVKVVEPTKWTTYRKVPERDEWAVHDTGPISIGFIPYVPVYGEFVGYMVGAAPLKEVAHLNVKHWQSQSDQDTILHVARVPILAVTGVEDNPKKPFEVIVGAATSVKLPLNATIEYVEHTGAAIDAGKVSLDDLKEEMRQAGAELLVLRPAAATATEVASDNAVGMCTLQQIALMTQDALNLALEYMAAWAKEKESGEVTLFSDFVTQTRALLVL